MMRKRRNPLSSRPVRDQSGFSVIQVLVALGIMGVLMSALITSQINLMKTNNFLEFQMNRTQLSGAISGLFLRDPANCGCLFRGANAFPEAGVDRLLGVNPTAIGRFQINGAGACAGIPEPLINAQGIDGMRLLSVSLQDIRRVSSSHSGVFSVQVETVKNVAGPRSLKIEIPVHVEVTPLPGGQVTFKSCSESGGSGQSAWVAAAPIFLCSGETWKCGTPTGVISSAWTNFDLKSLGVPGSARVVHLRSYVVEAQIYVKKATDPSPPDFRNRVILAQDDYGATNDVRIDIEGANGVISYAVSLTDPPSHDAMLQLIAYEE